MRAAFFKGKDQPLQIEKIKKFKPIKDQVLVRLNHAALNHRDLGFNENKRTSPILKGLFLAQMVVVLLKM